MNLFLAIFFSIFLPNYVLSEYENISSSHCGAITNITYPFQICDQHHHNNFGHPRFQLNCIDDILTIDIEKERYKVINLSVSDRRLIIARMAFSDDKNCADHINSTPMDLGNFYYTSADANATLLYGCRQPLTLNQERHEEFHCRKDKEEAWWGYLVDNYTDVKHDGCKIPSVKVLLDRLKDDWGSANRGLMEGFEVSWAGDLQVWINCFSCSLVHEPAAPRPAAPRPEDPQPAAPSSQKIWHMGVGIGAGAAFISSIGLVAFLFYRRKIKYASTTMVSRNLSPHPSSIKDFEKGGIYFGLHLFSYAELEKATNKFDSANELGDGGFGTVYYGKLRDGHSVAIKRLYENNYKRVEQFMNEVEILTRLRHPNLVLLYGCTSRHARELLLVYEYIPNGTVADHLHGHREKPGALPWHTRMKIAVETANALTYLHASDIIHRDVKTDNILLGNNFCVKVADFGLSRLFPINASHVSTAPQGTPGYVDPEYHECYQLTDKSDVYSFGVVLIELISSKPAVDIMRHRHEINLSDMAINKIQNHQLHELVDPCLGFVSNNVVRRMITAVAELAFQCLQSIKDMRPSMEVVLEVLKEIQCEDSSKNKPDEMEIPVDDLRY